MKRLIATLLVILFSLEGLTRVLSEHLKSDAVLMDAAYQTHWADGYWEPDDLENPTLNIRGGERRTVGQPEHAAHTVWIFGDSLMFSSRTPDEDTVASKLQALVGSSFRVVNRSVPQQRAASIYAWLIHTPVQMGDVVIFSHSWDQDFIDQQARPIAPWLKQICEEPLAKRPIVTIFIVACSVAAELPPDADKLKQGWDVYEATLSSMAAYTAYWGATFIRLDRLSFHVPTSGTIDAYGHYNGDGAAIVARAIFDYLTVF